MTRFACALAAAFMLAGCAATQETAEVKEETNAAAPAPRRTTAVAVTPTTIDHAELLKSSDPKLAANKKLAYDFFRIVLRGRRLDQADAMMDPGYIQHNPNADTGMAGFKAYFSALPGGEQPIPEKLDDMVHIHAEGDYVTMLFVREYDDPGFPGEKYTTTWFDTLRIVDGKLVEHWDSAMKGGVGPAAAKSIEKAKAE